MSRETGYLFLGLIFIGALYIGLTNYRNDTDRLLTRFNAQLKEEKFEELYDESSDHLHLNVAREEFVRRMKVAVGKLKSIDPELAFQTGRELETEIFGRSENDGSDHLMRLQRLKKNDVSVGMLVYWDKGGIFPKFTDFGVIATGEDAHKYQTPSVSYKTISDPENY